MTDAALGKRGCWACNTCQYDKLSRKGPNMDPDLDTCMTAFFTNICIASGVFRRISQERRGTMLTFSGSGCAMVVRSKSRKVPAQIPRGRIPRYANGDLHAGMFLKSRQSGNVSQ